MLVTGFAFHLPLRSLAKSGALKGAIVASVLFLMALPLEIGAMWRALRRPAPAMLAIGVNLGLLPLVAWGISLGLRGPLAVGLLVAAATPCTLASAAVWTRRAGGNDAVALVVTILTNLTCFIITPLWLLAMTGQEGVDIPVGDMISRLGLLVVLPILAAQLLRLHRPTGEWALRRKTPLSVAAQIGILSIVLIGAVTCGGELAGAAPDESLLVRDYVAMLVAVVAVHLIALAAGHALAKLLGIDRENRIAVGFAGSQKTLMVGLYVAVHFYGGLAILPMVAYHVGQLVVDTVIADRLRRAQMGGRSSR